MADIQKFLNQSGVSTLWTQVANKIATDVAAEKTRAEAAEKTLTDNLAAEVTRAKAAEKANADAIAILNGASSVEGSVAFQIAKIVAGADGDFDTLKEIADWIAAHPESVASLNSAITSERERAMAAEEANADAIAALGVLVGDKAVATQIADAIAAAQHASADDLSAAIGRIANLETWKSALEGTGQRLITADEISKLSKLVLGSDGSVSMSGTISADNVQGLSTAIDNRIATQVVALTTAEIEEICK